MTMLAVSRSLNPAISFAPHCNLSHVHLLLEPILSLLPRHSLCIPKHIQTTFDDGVTRLPSFEAGRYRSAASSSGKKLIYLPLSKRYKRIVHCLKYSQSSLGLLCWICRRSMLVVSRYRNCQYYTQHS
jgi:hypothetical protein